LVKVTCRRK